jgi:hypothetical protein
MAVIFKETLEDLRNRLILECKVEPQEQRAGYVNGVLDMYNLAKKLKTDDMEAT